MPLRFPAQCSFVIGCRVVLSSCPASLRELSYEVVWALLLLYLVKHAEDRISIQAAHLVLFAFVVDSRMCYAPPLRKLPTAEAGALDVIPKLVAGHGRWYLYSW